MLALSALAYHIRCVGCERACSGRVTARRKLYSPAIILLLKNRIRDDFRRPEIQNFPGGACPQTLLVDALRALLLVMYAHVKPNRTTSNFMATVLHDHCNHIVNYNIHCLIKSQPLEGCMTVLSNPTHACVELLMGDVAIDVAALIILEENLASFLSISHGKKEY